MRDVVLCLATLVGLFFALRRPWIGALMLACFSYLNPQRLCFGFAYALPFFLITAVCTVLGIVISGQWPRAVWGRDVWLLLGLIIWMNVTFLSALNPEGAHLGWTRTMIIMATVFLSAGLLQDQKKLTLLLWVIGISIGFYGVKGGIFTLVGGGQYTVQGPADSFMSDNNQLAVGLSMTLPLLRYLQLQVTSKWARLAFTGAITLTALSILGSYSRGGVLALGVVAILIWAKSRRKFVYAVAVVGCAAALLAVMPDKWGARMHTIDSDNYDESTRGRFNAWQFAVNLANDRPLTGGGFHSFTPELFQRYAPDPEDYHVAHSVYFEMLGDQGYPGLLLFIGFFGSTWLTAGRLRRKTRHIEDLQWAGDMAGMLQVSLAAYLVGGAFLSLAYFDLPYQIALTVVGCSMVVNREISKMHEATDEVELESGFAVAHPEVS